MILEVQPKRSPAVWRFREVVPETERETVFDLDVELDSAITDLPAGFGHVSALGYDWRSAQGPEARRVGQLYRTDKFYAIEVVASQAGTIGNAKQDGVHLFR